MRYEFNPNFSCVGQVAGCRPIAGLAEEVGVYSASPEFIRKHCGGIANELLDLVPAWYYDEADQLKLWPNCDIRIHRLYPGDFPAYPGWHCDGEWRETYFSQPDMNRIQVHKHMIATVSSHECGVSNTQFLDEPLAIDVVSPDCDHTLWGQVDRAINAKQSKRLFDTQDGQLMCFDSWTPHRVMPAKIRGWRMFFRMSMWHKPNLGDGGKISRQEQVYKLAEGSGW